MPVVNVGLARTRDLIGGFTAQAVDSLGLGTSDAADAATITRLGVAGTSYWKTGGAVTITRSESVPDPGNADPWVQWEASFATGEANDIINEIGVSVATANHAAQDDTKLYTRKKIGPLTKTSDIEFIGRCRVTY